MVIATTGSLGSSVKQPGPDPYSRANTPNVFLRGYVATFFDKSCLHHWMLLEDETNVMTLLRGNNWAGLRNYQPVVACFDNFSGPTFTSFRLLQNIFMFQTVPCSPKKDARF